MNGRTADFEVHFVHKNKSPNARDALAVLAVRGYVSPGLASMGIFSKLNPSQISKVNKPVRVKGIKMSELFPSNFDYYYYEGSPPCTETVQWFVLKNTIKVPGSYLKNLRKIDNGHGRPLTNNFRQAQALNGRKVYLLEVSQLHQSIIL